MNNNVENVTFIDGVDARNFNDAAIFARIGSVNAEMKALQEMNIPGIAAEKAIAALKAKADTLVGLVNSRHVDENGEITED